MLANNGIAISMDGKRGLAGQRLRRAPVAQRVVLGLCVMLLAREGPDGPLARQLPGAFDTAGGSGCKAPN